MIVALRLSALSLCGAIAACTPAEPPADALRWAISGVPSQLDPARADDQYSKALVLLIHDTPLRYAVLARPYRLVPQLAADLPTVSADGLTWTVHLRDDIRFADGAMFASGTGRAIRAADLAWSLARHADPRVRSKAGAQWTRRVRGLDEWAQRGARPDDPIEGLHVVDDLTLEIALVAPYPDLPHLLAQPFSAILPRELAAIEDPGFAHLSAGSGPYRLQSLDDSQARLIARNGYAGQPFDAAAEGWQNDLGSHRGLDSLSGSVSPMTSALQIDFLPADDARWRSFLRADGTAFIEVPPSRLPDVLERWDPLTLKPAAQRWRAHAGLESASLYFGFNLADPDFGRHPDPEIDHRHHRLRCAVLDAIDPYARNRQFHGDAALVSAGVIPPVVWEGSKSPEPQHIRLARARATLGELASTPPGLPELHLAVVAGTESRLMFEAVRGWLAAAGYPPERVRIDVHSGFAAFNQAVDEGRTQLMDLGWGLDYPDPLAALQPFHGPEIAPGPNVTRFADTLFDADFAQASGLAPGEARNALIARMDRRIRDACVVSPSLSRRRLYLWHADVLAYPDREVLGSRFLAFARRL